MELTDGHVTLRRPVADDAEAIVAGVRHAQPELAPWMPWAVGDYDPADALRWINLELDPHPFVIINKAATIVGSVGLNGIDESNMLANLGYWLRTDAVGNGYATAATKLLATYGIDQIGLHRIEIIMSTENEPSRRVAERAGATYEGVLRNRLRLHGRSHDAHSFSITPDDR